MSIPPQYATNRDASEVTENCRDFLRTGRCKYGASCKYNHPANVQSGGGMKTPLDPSEPLFPIRPNEPLCQYYMKHGTCKFAQACKFNHPPQNPQYTTMSSGSTPVVMMNVGTPNDSPQIVLNQIDAGNSHMALQFLPQRPDEPDCIYFLKNGRCKYGSTCRYHHPLNYHRRRAEDQRRHHEQRRQHNIGQERYQPVHFVNQSPQLAGLPQGHVYVSDGNPVALLNVDRDGGQSYQQFSVVMGADGTSSYCVPVGSTVGTTEQGSSTSSIASSYGTHVSDQGHLYADDANTSWARRSGSVNGLSVQTTDSRGQPVRGVLPHSVSDGSIARRTRTFSHGSANEGAVYYDAAASRMRRNGSSGSWRTDRNSPLESPLEHQQAMHAPQQYPQRHDMYEATGNDMRRSRPPGLGGIQQRRNLRRSPRREGGDEGFTMMTSALLNMLDTPEELPSEAFSDEDMYPQPPRHVAHEVDPSLFERLSLEPVPPGGGYVPRPDGSDQSWSPTWQGGQPGNIDDSEAMEMIHSRQQQGPSTGSSQDPNVGLYLP